jgi:hypothetical protein
MQHTSSLDAQLFGAVSSNDLISVERLLANGANIEAMDEEGTTPLHVATALGYTAMVKLLIARGANINAINTRGATTLTLARAAYTLAKMIGREGRAAKYWELTRWLREHGAVDTPGTEPQRKWWQFWK